MDTNRIYKNEFKIIGIEVRTTNKDNEGAIEASRLWERYLGEGLGEKISGRLKPEVNLGVYLEYDKDFNIWDGYYTYIVGAEVDSLDEIPEGMVGRVIPGSDYEVFTAKGPVPEKVGEAWSCIWGRYQQNAGPQRAFSGDIEVYDQIRLFGGDAPEVDIYISVK